MKQKKNFIPSLHHLMILLLFFINLNSYGQLQTLTVPNQYLQFGISGTTINSLPQQNIFPSAYGYTGTPANFASNSMYNSEGDLLFFIVDSKVYDGKGFLIGEMVIDYFSPFLPNSEWAIIPVPGNCCKFYIVGAYTKTFGGNSVDYPSGLYYTTLDMCERNLKFPNDENRFGALETESDTDEYITHQIFTFSDGHDVPTVNNFLAVSDLTTNGDRKLFFTFTNFLHRFSVGANNITLEYSFQLGPFINSWYFGFSNSECELIKKVNGNYVVAVPKIASDLDLNGVKDTEGIKLIEMDANFNILNTGFCHLGINTEPNFHGLEFSNDGNTLYYTCYDTPYVGYFDINNVTTPINTTLSQVSNPSNYRSSFIERGFNDKMYYVYANGLSTLDNPNLPGSSVFVPLAHLFNNNLQTQHNFNGSIQERYYALPDQIDIDNLNSLITDITSECCERFTGYELEDYSTVSDPTVSTIETWSPGVGNNPWDDIDGTVHVQSELRINNGYNITINGMIFKFAPNARMIIEKNARVTSKNSTYTSLDCDGLMWRGVEVWGTASVAHSTINNINYGYIGMFQNSEISNAIVGITSCERDVNFNSLLTQSGGYIVATNSNFINNQIDINLTPHVTGGFFPTQSNKSIFRGCHFTTTGILKDQTMPDSHVKLVQVSGVKFHNNTFENTTPLLYPVSSNRGTGIYSLDSKFDVTFGCNSPQLPGNPCPEVNRIGNTFSHLYYGINASSFLRLRNFVCEYSQFNEVHRGIRMVGMNFCKIDKNDFYIGSVNPGFNLSSYGIHQTNCSGYFLQNNHFEDANNGTYGVVTVNSGAFNNLIRNNTFEDVDYGATAINRNFGLISTQNPQYVGLQYLCNDFTGSTNVDVQVTKTPLAVDGGVRAFQGFCSPTNNTNPANNIFSLIVPTLKHFTLSSTVQPSNYHIPQDANGFNVDPNNVSGSPVGYSETFCPNNRYDSKLLVCAENTYSLFSNGQLLSQINLSKSEIASLIELIDGGNTNNLLNSIATQSSGQIKNSLMALSPYLSDEVLLAYLATNPPSGHIKQIILANSPVSKEVMAYINGMNIPNGIRNQINTGQNGASGMDVLKDDVSAVVWVKDMASDELLRRYLNDTLVDRLDSMDIVLKENENVESDAIRVSVKIYQGKYVDAITLIADIRSITNQYNDYLKLMESLIIIYQCQDKAYRLNWDTPLKQDVEAIANAGTEKIECKNAGAILELLKVFSQPEVFQNVDPSEVRAFFKEETVVDYFQSFKLYPNPADHFVNVQTDKVYELIEVTVFDITGKQIQYQKVNNVDYVLLETPKLNSGIYLVEVKMDGTKSEVQKLIIE